MNVDHKIRAFGHLYEDVVHPGTVGCADGDRDSVDQVGHRRVDQETPTFIRPGEVRDIIDPGIEDLIGGS